MLNKSLRILNFDDSILKQEKLLSRYENNIIDLKHLAPQARYWINPKDRSVIEERIAHSSGHSVTFLGSGDFHHISEILISRFNEPMNVIIFDFHPDWAILPPRYGCGSWVSEVLKKKNILKIILLGVSSADISSFDIQTGNVNSLKDNRVEIYPYVHGPSITFLKKIPENISIEIENGVFFHKIYWNEIKGKNLPDFLQKIIKRLIAKTVYVSIDKDCLKNDYAVTNWEEGMVSLEELLLMLKSIKENLDIIGVDITGDYSPITVKGIFKKIASALDHPGKTKEKSIPECAIHAINEETNLKIVDILNSEQQKVSP